MWKGKKEVVKGSKQTDEMICFYQSDPTRRGHQKQVIGFWRKMGTFEITKQRLADQARAIRTNEWSTCSGIIQDKEKKQDIQRWWRKPRD